MSKEKQEVKEFLGITGNLTPKILGESNSQYVITGIVYAVDDKAAIITQLSANPPAYKYVVINDEMFTFENGTHKVDLNPFIIVNPTHTLGSFRTIYGGQVFIFNNTGEMVMIAGIRVSPQISNRTNSVVFEVTRQVLINKFAITIKNSSSNNIPGIIYNGTEVMRITKENGQYYIITNSRIIVGRNYRINF